MTEPHKITVEIEPLPKPDAYARVIGGLRNVAEFAGYVGEDIESAVLKLLASVERRRQEGRAA